MAFYQEFRYCRVPNPYFLGNGICNNFNLFNTKACGFDGGDCLDFNKERPGCKAPDINRLGDGFCDGPEYNNEACDYDGGDCEDFNEKFPGCKAERPVWIKDNSCHAAFDRPGVMTEECKWDNGKCGHLLITGGLLLGNITTVELAILESGLSALFPDCDMGHVPFLMGNGICEDERLNTEECGWEAGDCIEWNKKYPGCAGLFAPTAIGQPRLGMVGDGTCNGNTPDGPWDTPECGYDGGDCVKFREEYPGCKAPRPGWLGDGGCDGGPYATEECGYDGGDCINVTMPADSYPNCYATRTWMLGDGRCDGYGLNSEECGFEGGDCDKPNELYPGCFAYFPEKLSNGFCDLKQNTTECNYDGFDCINSTVLFQYGEKVSLEDYRADTKTFTAVQITFSAISFLASIVILIVINRSHEGLSTTLNRLLFGLCFSDVLSSIFQCLGTLPAPKEYADVIWSAKGNVASCEAQGFFIFAGSMAAPLYNCSLCFYYLTILKFNKKEDFIKQKIEPFLHAVPILFSLLGGFIILGLKAFNPNMTYCFIGPDPTCDDVNCDRIKDSNVLFIVFSAAPYIILPSVIGITMFSIYHVVLVQEKKLEKYGIGGLRKKATKKAAATASVEESTVNEKPRVVASIRKFFKKGASNQKDNSVAVRKKKKQSRVVLNTALSYSIAFLLSYLLPMVISILTLSDVKSPFWLSIAVRILFPLQGFFNCCVYLYPHVTAAKRKHKNIGWFSAFLKALVSRGPKKKVSRSLKSDGRKRTTLISLLSSKFSIFKSKRQSSTLETKKSSKHTLAPSASKVPVSSSHTSTNITTAVTTNHSPTSAVSRGGLSSTIASNFESTTTSATASNVESVNRDSEIHPVGKSTVEKIETIVEDPVQQEVSASDGIDGRVVDEELAEDEELVAKGSIVTKGPNIDNIQALLCGPAQQVTPSADAEDTYNDEEAPDSAQQEVSADDGIVERAIDEVVVEDEELVPKGNIVMREPNVENIETLMCEPARQVTPTADAEDTCNDEEAP